MFYRNCSLIVQRDSATEKTCAAIQWDGVTETDFLKHVRRALADWFKTPEGHEALEESGFHFSIEDLSNVGRDEGISEALAAHEIYDLQIDVYSVDYAPDWTFDTFLCGEDDEADA